MIQQNPAEPHQSTEPEQVTFTFDDRQWRIRGLEKQLSCERLRVNLLVSRRELVHVDTLDLYVARQRHTFVKQAAAELYVEEATIKRDLGRVLLQLEARQELLIREQLGPRSVEVPVMSPAERKDALELLQDPQLIERILADYDACGLVGEETNKLVCYLACTSRLLPRPLSVLVQSSSAAGKTSLVEATLQLMPAEAQVRLSALTSQSLYYMGAGELQHKILAIAEEAGVAEASYALKLLQSEGKLSIACAGKDSDTGRQRTQHYEVEGPVAMLLTTTAEEPDEELANRCITLSVNEQPEQTAAIHARQRSAYTLSAEKISGQAVRRRHQHAQRLLEPLAVVIPDAEELTFRTDQTRHRRDHAKYLSLIAALALLHQHQRGQTTRTRQGTAERCVIATPHDVQLAQQLCGAALAQRLDELLPHTRQLLVRIEAYVRERCEQQQVTRQQLRFSQRELREALSYSDRSLRRQLSRLVQLEYVVMHRTGLSNRRLYQLLYDSESQQAAPWLLGLDDLVSGDGNGKHVPHSRGSAVLGVDTEPAV